MRLSILLSLSLLSIGSHISTAQTTVGAFGALGVSGLHGIGISGFKLLRAPGPGIGFTVKHPFGNGLFLAAEPALRNIRQGSGEVWTDNAGQPIREYLVITAFNTTSLPVYAGMYLVKAGSFRPWLGLGGSFHNMVIHSYEEGHKDADSYPLRNQYILITNYLGFDAALGKATLSLLAAYSPYYFLSQKGRYEDEMGQVEPIRMSFKGNKQIGVSANCVRLSCQIPVGAEGSGISLVPGLEAISLPLYAERYIKPIPYQGYLALRFGVVKVL